MTYKNCSDAYDHGVANIPSWHPSYQPKLDADHDGVGCDQPPTGVTVHAPSSPSVAASVPGHASTGQTALPVTGADGGDPVTLGFLGGTVLAVGVAVTWIARRRYWGRHR